MDGVARLWSNDGILQHSLDAHSESIFSLRFDATSTRLLTGSYDKCVSVWDVSTGMKPAQVASCYQSDFMEHREIAAQI